MRRKVTFSAIGKGQVNRHMGNVKRLARRACLGNRKLALRLKFAERAVRRQAGDCRDLLFDLAVIVVRWAGFQERVQTDSAERYRPVEGQQACDQNLPRESGHLLKTFTRRVRLPTAIGWSTT